MKRKIVVQSGTRSQILSYFYRILGQMSGMSDHKKFFETESRKLGRTPGNGKLYKGVIKIL